MQEMRMTDNLKKNSLQSILESLYVWIKFTGNYDGKK
jgi:hypothetical protein